MTPARLRESFFGEINGPLELQRKLVGSEGAAPVLEGGLEVTVDDGGFVDEGGFVDDGGFAVPGIHWEYHSGVIVRMRPIRQRNHTLPLTIVQTPSLHTVGPLEVGIRSRQLNKNSP